MLRVALRPGRPRGFHPSSGGLLRSKQELATAQGTLETLNRRIENARLKCSEAGSAMEFLFATGARVAEACSLDDR